MKTSKKANIKSLVFLSLIGFILSIQVIAQTPLVIQPQFSDYTDINPDKNLGNPLHLDIFAPDPSARVWPDGRLYLYPSRDTPGEGFYGMESWHVLSSENLVDWTNHGRIFHVTDIPWAKYKAWAPDCAYKDGTYYFYFPCNDTIDQNWVGVATSSSPTGPFVNPTKLVRGVDPNIFTDYEGNYWYAMNNSIQKLSDNMTSLEGPIYRWNDFTVNFPNYEKYAHEGTWIFKRNGLFYLMSASSSPEPRADGNTQKHVLIYGISEKPTGPYVYKGIVMNTIGNPYSPKNPGNNHGSIVEYKGKWILFYHKWWKAPDGNVHRATCADYVNFNADGTIQEVIPTDEGVDFRNLVNSTSLLNTDIKVYQNHINESINIEFDYSLGRNRIIEIYDINGIEMKRLITSHNSVKVKLTGINKGVYLLKINDDKKIVKTVKFIIGYADYHQINDFAHVEVK